MKKFVFLYKIFLFSFLFFITCIFAFYAYAYITPKEELSTSGQILIYKDDGELAFENINGEKWTKLSDISQNVINATISAEDKNFYNHKGFDYPRILKAIFINIKSNSLSQGASTISQQYIKNLYLDFGKTWKRKIEEAFLTFELEVHYSKDEILEGYLNTINYGAGNYGIENASEYYFNKSSKDLTIAEAAMLVGIPKNPTYYNPINYYDNAKKRQKLVLKSMVNNKIITEEEMNKIYNEKLSFYGNKEDKKLTSAYYYKDAVLEELKTISSIPDSLIETGGLKIYTNLNLESQEILENNIKNELQNIEDIQVASIIADVKTGKIKALIGGYDYMKSQYNRATQAKRQVGSTMKPFLYYSALANGFTSSSIFTSEETTFNLGNNKTYSPKNYGSIYGNKNITLAAAIAFSDNIYAVKTHLFLGTSELVNIASKVGIKTEFLNNASLPLGSTEISMIDFANGYITLANEGIRNDVYLIEKITDINDNILYEHEIESEQVINKKYVFILNELLSNTYNYLFVDYTSPTMLGVKDILTKKYAVKSGSTSYDTWTIGYNPDELVMVWCGFDDNESVGKDISKANKKIWAYSIEQTLKDKENTWYEIPNNVVAALVNPISGEIGTEKNTVLYYIKGTEPTLNNTLINSLFKDEE